MTIIQHPSPNHSSRSGWKPDLIVEHITAGSTAAGAIATLCDPAREASAHFVVDRDGTVYQLVPLDRAAWANGTSSTPSDKRYYGRATLEAVRNRRVNANLYTVSIEHVCVSGGALTKEQLAASIALHKHIIAEAQRLYGVAIPADRQHIVGHCEINPVTKPNCPGAQFPYSKILDGLKNTEVKSDTTQDVTLKKGSSYHVKLTSSVKPAFTVGNGEVLQTFTGRCSGDEYIFGIRAVGAPGSSAGVYANGKLIFNATIK